MDETNNSLPVFLLRQDITRAFVYFAVFFLSSLLLWTAYLNFVLLQPYFPPLFWAVVVSVPLHSLKTHILEFAEIHFIRGGSLLALFVVVTKVGFKLLVGPVWVVFEYLLSVYFKLISSISAPGVASETPSVMNKSKRKFGTPKTSPPSSSEVSPKERKTNQVGVPGFEFDSTPSRSGKRWPQTLRHRGPRPFSYHSSDSPFSIPRFGIINPDANIGKYEIEGMRNTSVSEKIVGSLKQANSTKYFSLLFRMLCLYGFTKFILILERPHYIIAVSIFFIIITTHIFYHLLLLIARKMSQTALISTITRSSFISIVGVMFQITLGLPFKFLISISKLIQVSFLNLVKRHINLIVTSLLFLACVGFMIITSGFIFFKLVQEVNGVIESAIELVNYATSTSTKSITGDDQELAQRFQNALTDMRNYALKYGNDRLLENFPSLNMTLPELYGRFSDSVFHFKTELNGLWWGFPSETTVAINHNTTISTPIFEANFKQIFSKLLNATSTLLNSDIRKKEVFVEFASGVVFEHVRNMVLNLLNAFTYAFNLTLDIALFSLVTFYLTLNEQSPVFYASQILIVIDTNQRLRLAVERAIKAVFLSTVKMAVFHFVFIWLSFSMAGIEYVYFYSVLGSVFAVVPIVNPFWICLPALLQLLWRSQIWIMLVLAISHLWVMFWADAAIYSDIPDSNQYVVAYTIILGLWAYGWKGLVIGPVLACLPVIGYHVVYELIANVK